MDFHSTHDNDEVKLTQLIRYESAILLLYSFNPIAVTRCFIVYIQHPPEFFRAKKFDQTP